MTMVLMVNLAPNYVIYWMNAGVAYDAFDSNQMDITDQVVVNEKISALKPEVIYHCAAYTIMSLMGPMKASMKLMRPLIHGMNMVKLNLPVKKQFKKP